jgi:hypothetical protein
MLDVASFAASATVVVTVTMTSGLLATTPVHIAGRRERSPPAER